MAFDVPPVREREREEAREKERGRGRERRGIEGEELAREREERSIMLSIHMHFVEVFM